MVHTEAVRVCLAGNPNSGKTTIFNALTGARQHVGNYPGVTVEKREGTCHHGDRRYQVLDLPGTYSLTSYSPEERIAQAELVDGQPDVTVVVVDSTTLKRSLVLLAQIMQIGPRMVLCLNMSDEARRGGQQLDLKQMERLLGFPIVETIGSQGRGIDALKEAIARAADSPDIGNRLVLGQRLDDALAHIEGHLAGSSLYLRGGRWIACKLLCDDPSYVERVHRLGDAGRAAIQEAGVQRTKIIADTRVDIGLYVTERYYGFVDGLLREVVRKPSRADARARSDRIDAILAHRVLGVPIFLGVMYLIFWVTFRLGEIPMGWIESSIHLLGRRVSGFWPTGSDSILRSMLVDGIIGGVGGVIVFLPNILLLFLGLAFLEDTGYMARAAFLVDRLMHRFGLHGKSFIPMMVGFGCTVPAIMATRTLENERDRLTTMLVLPLMSCGARLPIWMLLIPAFFPVRWRAPALWGVYMFGILLALMLALLLRRSILRGEDAPFVMELPPYRLPTGRAVLTKMLERSWLYIRKAGTIILGLSVVMWFLTAFPRPDIQDGRADSPVYGISSEDLPGISAGEQPSEPAAAVHTLSHSFAGRIGHAIEPILRPLGFDWRIATALLGAFGAKEVFVAQMGIVYSLSEAPEDLGGLQAAMRRDYTPLTGISLILFLLIATPCMATIAITRRESGRWRWALLQFAGLTAIAYVLSGLVYQIGRLVV